jgi:hypothetical protein
MAEAQLPPHVAAKLKQEKLMRAYRDLFGANEAARSETQILVWEDLRKRGYEDLPTWVADKEGKICPYRAAITDGSRNYWLYIKANVNFQPKLER